jgi:tetratricopeptide (TPR) repeat protein
MILRRREYRGSLFALLFFIFLLPVLDPELVPSYPKIVIRFAYIPAIFAGVFFIDTIQLFRNRRLKVLYVVLLCIIGSIWLVETYRFQVYFKNGNEHYQRLAEDFPEDGSIVLPLALLKAGNGEHGQALQLVNRALAAGKKDRWLDVSELGGLLKANLLVVTGKEEEGKTMAENILAETKKDEMKYFAFLVLSKYHEKKWDLAAALAFLKKAGGIGETADLFYRTAILHAQLKDYDSAFSCLEKAKALNPGLPRYGELKQILLNEKNQTNKTIETRSVTGD